jgi:hypothetical protein
VIRSRAGEAVDVSAVAGSKLVVVCDLWRVLLLLLLLLLLLPPGRLLRSSSPLPQQLSRLSPRTDTVAMVEDMAMLRATVRIARFFRQTQFMCIALRNLESSSDSEGCRVVNWCLAGPDGAGIGRGGRTGAAPRSLPQPAAGNSAPTGQGPGGDRGAAAADQGAKRQAQRHAEHAQPEVGRGQVSRKPLKPLHFASVSM